MKRRDIGALIVFLFLLFFFQRNIKDVFLNWLPKESSKSFSALCSLYTTNSKSENYDNFLFSRLVDLRRLEEENKDLKKALNQKWAHEDFLFSHVLFKDLSQGEVVLDRGKKSGVFLGDLAISADNVLLGRVVDVFSTRSLIRSATFEKGFTGEVLGKNSSVYLRGKGRNFSLDVLPGGEDVQEGDLIITNGLDGIFPSGILIGHISSLVPSDTKIFQSGIVEPLINFNSLNNLFIFKGIKK